MLIKAYLLRSFLCFNNKKQISFIFLFRIMGYVQLSHQVGDRFKGFSIRHLRFGLDERNGEQQEDGEEDNHHEHSKDQEHRPPEKNHDDFYTNTDPST